MGGSIQGTPLVLSGSVTTFAGTTGALGSSDGTGTLFASFSLPNGVTTDGTNLYVADTDNHIIRQIVINTGVVTTLAGLAGNSGSSNGTGSAARFNRPYGITTDGTNLYVADTLNHTIRKIVIATGDVTTLAGSAGILGSTDATGALAGFNFPRGITTDAPDGTNLYVSDTNNHTIRRVIIATGTVTTLAGLAGVPGAVDASGSAARFNFPSGITTDGTNLYVADTNNHTIRSIVIASAAATTLAGTATASGTADNLGTAARFNLPSGITTDGTSLYVSDTNNHTIRKIVISTTVVTTLAGLAGTSGTTNGFGTLALFNGPYGITTDGIGLYLADSGNHTIRRIQ